MPEEQSQAMTIMKQLFRIDRNHKIMIDAQINRLGIHRSQHHVLMYLHYCKEAPTQETIAKKLEISPAAVAVTLKKLEAAGLIERDIRKENGREKEVRLTEEGEEIVKVSRERFEAADEVVTKGFTDEELSLLEGFLDRIAENLKAATSAGPEGAGSGQKGKEEDE